MQEELRHIVMVYNKKRFEIAQELTRLRTELQHIQQSQPTSQKTVRNPYQKHPNYTKAKPTVLPNQPGKCPATPLGDTKPPWAPRSPDKSKTKIVYFDARNTQHLHAVGLSSKSESEERPKSRTYTTRINISSEKGRAAASTQPQTKRHFYSSPYKKCEKMEPSKLPLVAAGNKEVAIGSAGKGMVVRRTTYLVKLENKDCQSRLPSTSSAADSNQVQLKLPPLSSSSGQSRCDPDEISSADESYESDFEETAPHMFPDVYDKGYLENDDDTDDEVPPHLQKTRTKKVVSKQTRNENYLNKKQKKSVSFAPDTRDINREEKMSKRADRADMVMLPHLSKKIDSSSSGSSMENKVPVVLDKYTTIRAVPALPHINSSQMTEEEANTAAAKLPRKLRQQLPLLFNRNMLTAQNVRISEDEDGSISEISVSSPRLVRSCREEAGNPPRRLPRTFAESSDDEASIRLQPLLPKTSYWYRDSHYKPKTVIKPS